MRIFAWEYVTAGGVEESPASASMVAEGAMMVRALVRDLSRIPGVETIAACHPAVDPGSLPAFLDRVGRGDPWPDWRRITARCDAIWPIAPETDGVLERITQAALAEGRIVLNSRNDALAVARSKRLTAQCLAARGIPAVPTVPLDAPPPDGAAWVVKPDDGAGAADTHLVMDRAALEGRRGAGASLSLVVQPFLRGTPLSLSMLAQGGVAWLLSCNLQHVDCARNAFSYRGGVVGGAEDRRSVLEPLAEGIAAALPGLWGYVGVDVIDAAQGPVVLEINPRLTTSYVGLGESLGINPASLVLSLLDRPLASLIRPLARRPVEIRVPTS